MEFGILHVLHDSHKVLSTRFSIEELYNKIPRCFVGGNWTGSIASGII